MKVAATVVLGECVFAFDGVISCVILPAGQISSLPVHPHLQK
jgi:hypothetical protein